MVGRGSTARPPFFLSGYPNFFTHLGAAVGRECPLWPVGPACAALPALLASLDRWPRCTALPAYLSAWLCCLPSLPA